MGEDEQKDSKKGPPYGYWLVAFIDLLGQKDAFCKMDFIPTTEAEEERFIEAVKDSVSVIKRMRNLLATFAAGRDGFSEDSPLNSLSPEKRERAELLKRTQVREHRLSDGVMLACPLKPGPGHTVPVFAVYDILRTCMGLMLVQLAMGRPIRGGIDVGVAVEDEGELFGPAMVKAYVLESKKAQFPRIVVGQTLVDYLTSTQQEPGNTDTIAWARNMARQCVPLIARDSDGEWVLDYVGQSIRNSMSGDHLKQMVSQSLDFARKTRAEQQALGKDGEKLFGRYSQLLRYLDSRTGLWGLPTG